ncbi:MAG: ribosome small subunit-dependent GTPase A [Candidatus Eisenbacteria bacterium]
MCERLDGDERLETGIVFRKARGLYDVRTDTGQVQCSISSKLRKELLHPTSDPGSGTSRAVQRVDDIHAVDPVAIGDEVRFAPAEPGHGHILEVEPRRNALSRSVQDVKRRGDGKAMEQVIVANVDQVVAVFAAAKPRPTWHLLDRYLVGIEASEIPPLICVTKMDLVDVERTREDVAVYERLGYSVVLTSSETGEGVEKMRVALTDRTSVLVGKSGVGKTTLLNALQPGLGLYVKEVSKSSGKGKHATTHLEMFPLDFGGGVVDTPGMKVFNPADDSMDVAFYFREMRPLLGQCRFGIDCSHTHEPGCVIKEAVEAGEIAGRRYESYAKML